ncbi:magnesium transporter CorA family protein [Paracoccaceae bacterium Fryx2]|nr:magnesium transporter CorA family protein [Paracoccaceae bacterium Fryx2]
MLFAYRPDAAGKLERLGPQDGIADALWVDLYRPLPGQVAQVAAFGVEVPTLAEMEEIEISNRLYRENGVDYMTVVLPGLSETKAAMAGPVTFIRSQTRLITVRHHVPRPFETYPDRADKVGPGCATPDQVFLGLIEEVVGRLADLLEGSGKTLDEVSRSIFTASPGPRRPEQLQATLERVGREGDLLGRVRLALLTIERAVSFFGQTIAERPGSEALRPVIKGLMRDVQALAVHGDFISSRVALVTDATLGMINLSQNQTIKIVSVVAVVFLPPTVIASAYGMNFKLMPELEWVHGYPMAIGLMLASAVGTYLFFKWRNWL